MIKAADRLVDGVIIVISSALLFLGIYSLLDEVYIYEGAADRSFLVYKPQLSEARAEDRKISDGQIGWICIEGTGVDFPLMQGKDNTEYLNKDPYGEFSYSGSIFLDSACSPDLSDGYSVIYGHHMSGGRMFGCLDEFRSEEYLKEHCRGVISAGGRLWDLQLFAVISCQAGEPCIFSPGSRDAADVDRFIRSCPGGSCIQEESFDGQGPDGTGSLERHRIVALTTCTAGGDLERLVICGYIVQREEEV